MLPDNHLISDTSDVDDLYVLVCHENPSQFVNEDMEAVAVVEVVAAPEIFENGVYLNDVAYIRTETL